MNVYSSCFIAVALQQKYQEEFEKLLTDIKNIDANIETVQSTTPHITLYYLNKQSQYSIDKIISLVKPELNILSNFSITVGGLGYFDQDNPKALFLNVIYPVILTDFNATLSEMLNMYGDVDNTHLFHPHLTAGRMAGNQAKESFNKNREKLRLRLDKIKWSFSFDEVVLYGVDSSKSPQHQEKLAVL